MASEQFMAMVLVQEREQRLAIGELQLVDPLEWADVLNNLSQEIGSDELGSSQLERLIGRMLEIAAGKDSEGGAQMVGLAAPQLGVSKRVCIVDINATGKRERQEMLVLVNPKIIQASDELVDGREGCWSAGSYCANVPRASWVVVHALDGQGRELEQKFEGFTARIVQHEIDHLDGIRCIDRVPEGEDWRLHRVDINDREEFDRYRTEWPVWQKTFPRSEWAEFRQGRVTGS